MINILKIKSRWHLIICKKSKFNHLKQFLNILSERGEKLEFIVLDSTRELHVLPVLFLIQFSKIKFSVLFVSVSSSVKAICSLRKPLKSKEIVRINYLFPSSLAQVNGRFYSFYNIWLTLTLSILRTTDSMPFYDGVHPRSKKIFSRFPLLEDHSTELRKNKIPCLIVNKFVSRKVPKDGVLFAVPQFYEQGFMTLKDSKKVIKQMLSFIEEENPSCKIDISLHPRMNIEDYHDIFQIYHQNNFTEIIPYFKEFYAINSSTIFIANQANCNCNIFKCDFLDYEIIEKEINSSNIKFIEWNVKKDILLNY